MKKKVIDNLARRLQKKYPRLYNSMGTKRVKRILSGILNEKIFVSEQQQHHADKYSVTVDNY